MMTPAAKFKWLEQIAADRRLRPLSLRLGLLLAVKYIRDEDHAWPSQKTLAADLQASFDGLRRAAADLAQCGHMSVTTGDGRSVTTRYRPILLDQNPRQASGLSQPTAPPKPPKKLGPFEPGNPRNSDAETPEIPHEKPPTPGGVTSSYETVERFKENTPGETRAPESPIPADFPSQELIAEFAGQFPNVDVYREAETFAAHAQAHDRRAANWPAAFRHWLLKPQATARAQQPNRPSALRDWAFRGVD